MSAAVAPTHYVYLDDGSKLTIGRINGGYAVLTCCAETRLQKCIDEHRGDLAPERVPERLRLAGPNPTGMYLPVADSPIDIFLETLDGKHTLIFRGMTRDTPKIPAPALR